MRWVLLLVAMLGMATSAAALREHYRTDTSPCSINDKWDCGVVNHSNYAVLKGIPVAVIGIFGYVLLAGLALKRAWRLLGVAAAIGLAFSLYLTYIEARVLGVWCMYCVISLAAIFSITILAVVQLLVVNSRRKSNLE
jgi:vitamin-K-epoxide reductase (warfarin-sensitive)